jgi:two-component system, cell cycle sensor histidine kinase and response regulator CckA
MGRAARYNLRVGGLEQVGDAGLSRQIGVPGAAGVSGRNQTELAAALLRAILCALAGWYALILLVGVPFIAVNKRGVVVTCLVAATLTLLLPYFLMRVGRLTAAVWALAGAAAALLVWVTAVSGGIRSPGMISQPALMICAAMLLGRRLSLVLVVPMLAADFAIAVYQGHGGVLPLVFPSPPGASLVHVLFAFGMLLVVYRFSVGTIGKELDAARRQFAEHEAAREQILHQNQLLAQSPDPVVATDNAYTVTFWNQAAERLFGWTEAEALGKHVHEVLPRIPGSIPEDAVCGSLSRCGLWSGDLTIFTKGGAQVVVDAKVSVLHNAAGEVAGSVAGLRDISANTRAEALLQSEGRLRELIEHTSDWIWEVDTDLRYTYASSKVMDILGYTPEEVIGKTPWDLMPAAEASRLRVGFEDFVRNPRPFHSLENTNLRKDGSTRILETSGVPVFDSTGRLAGFRGIDRDITDHKRAEGALRLSLFLRMSPDLVWRLDCDPPIPITLPVEEQVERIQATARMGECNDVVARHFGYASSSDIVGRPYRELMSITRGDYSDAMAKFVRNGYRLYGNERCSVRADGGRIYLLSSNVGIVEDGKLVSIWGDEQDFTERKRAEIELRAAHEELASIHANAPIMLLVLDEKLLIRKVNNRALEEFGRSAEQMLMRPPGEALGCLNSGNGCGASPGCPACAIHAAALSTLRTGEPHEHVEACVPLLRDGARVERRLSVSTALLEWDVEKRVLLCAQDVTDRTRDEQALRASEGRMRAIFDQAGVGVALVETKPGILRRVNQKFCDIVGRTQAELEGAYVRAFTHPDDRAADQAATDRLLSGEVSSSTLQKRYARPDGSIVWVSRTHSRLWEEGQEPTFHITVVEDITQSKTAEEEARHSQELLQAVIDNIPALVYVKDLDGRVVIANRNLANALGRKIEDVVGQIGYELVDDPEEGEKHARNNRRVVETGQAIAVEERLSAKEDARIYLSVKFPLRNAAGKIYAVGGVSTDITERKRAELALRASEERLALALEASSDGLFDWEASAGRMYFSPRCSTMLGYQPGELRPSWEAFADLLHPEDRDAVLHLVDEYLQGRRDRHAAEIRLRDASGGWRWILHRGHAVKRDSARRLFRMVGTLQDIHERKTAEVALRQSELFNREIIAGAREGLIVYDRQWRYQVWNPFMEELTGLPASDLLGKVAIEVFPHLGEQHVDEMLSHALAGETVHAPDSRYHVEPTGKSGWVSAIYSPHFGPTGEIIGVIGMVRDITETRRAEAELRKAYQQIRLLTNNLEEAVMAYDMDRRLIYANPAIEHLTGFSFDELQTGPFLLWVHPDDRERMLGLWADLFKGGSFQEVEYQVRTADGRVKWAESSFGPLRDESGRQIGVQGSQRDVTTRKNAQEERAGLTEQLQQAQKLESLGRLAGGIAHDFNNLLTVINGYSDVVLSRLRDRDPLRNPLSEIRKAGGRAAALTQQLLAFSRKQVTAPRPMDLNRLISDTQSMFERLLGEDIDLTARLAPDLGLIEADDSQFHQVLMNLLLNARDAMPSGGALVIETANVELDEESAAAYHGVQPGQYVSLAVTDTGAGMSEEVKRHIFEPFYTTKGEGKGTGLGLSTVYGIVRQCGGWIFVDSEPGCGSSFRIVAPRVAAEAAAQLAPPVPSTLNGYETVLVVEDQDEVRAFVVDLLRGYGYQVLEAATGMEALELAQRYKEPIHLLLTDAVMPRMTGKELVERLQPLRPDTSVLYMSGHPDNVIAHSGVLDPGLDYISKPFSPDELAAKIRAVLGPPRSVAKILVADDEEAVLRLFEKILTDAGYEVLLARDGDQAVEIASRGEINLVITDLVMPNREGIETIRAIKAGHPGLKIVAMSGAFKGSFLRMAELLGAHAALAKPVSPEQLLDVVAKALRS